MRRSVLFVMVVMGLGYTPVGFPAEEAKSANLPGLGKLQEPNDVKKFEDPMLKPKVEEVQKLEDPVLKPKSTAPVVETKK